MCVSIQLFSLSLSLQLPDDADNYLPKEDGEEQALLPSTSPSQIENGLNGTNGKRRGFTPEDERKSVEPIDLDNITPTQRKPGAIKVLPAVTIRGDSGSASLELDDITRTPDETDSLKVSNV